jgi:hypothetical protein
MRMTGVDPLDAPRGALGDERVPVGQERDAPGDVQAGRDHGRRAEGRGRGGGHGEDGRQGGDRDTGDACSVNR